MNAEQRKARLLELAEKWEKRAEEYYARYKEIADMIPPGQPILVGHHSERRHRRDIERMNSMMGKVAEAQKRAEEYRRRAEGVGTGGVSVHDEDALERLQAKLEAAKAKHEAMKKANRLISKALKDGRDPVELVPDLVALGIPEEEARNVTTGGFWGHGYTHATLNNSRARIRRLERRVREVAAIKSAPEAERRVGNVVYREADERVQLIFPGKPDADTRALLKRNGFKWSPRRGAWVRKLTQNGRWAAERVLEELNEA